MQIACLSSGGGGQGSAPFQLPITLTQLMEQLNTQPALRAWLQNLVVPHANQTVSAGDIWETLMIKLAKAAEENARVFNSLHALEGYISSRAVWAAKDIFRSRGRILNREVSWEELSPSKSDEVEADMSKACPREASEETEFAQIRLQGLMSYFSPKSRQLAVVLLAQDCFKATGTIDQGEAARHLKVNQSTISRMWATLKSEALAVNRSMTEGLA